MAIILPRGKTQFFDGDGDPLAFGKVYHYVPNTLDLKDTYQDSALSVLNVNPITLDANGECLRWGSGLYREIVKDSLLNTLSDSDTGDDNAGSGGGGGGDLTLIDFGADPTGAVSINAALAQIEADYPVNPVRIAVTLDDNGVGIYKVATNKAVAPNITFVGRGGVFRTDNAITLTLTGPIECDPNLQLFSNATAGQGTIAFTTTPWFVGKYNLLVVYPEWWGAVGDGAANDSAPINAALVAAVGIGAVCQLGTKIYKANVVLPTSVGTNSNPYPVIALHGVTKGLTTINAFSVASPAIELVGAGLTTNVFLDIRDFRAVCASTTNGPVVKLAGKTGGRLFGTLRNIQARNNSYNNGGGVNFHIEYHLSMGMYDCDGDRGWYLVYLANGSNLRAYNLTGRVNGGGFAWIQGGGENSFFGARMEDSSFVATDPTAALVRLIDTQLNKFHDLHMEGSTGIRDVIYMESTGTEPDNDPVCAYNDFTNCSFAAPERTDVATTIIHMKGYCYGNRIDSYISSLASSFGANKDVYLENNADLGKIPVCNDIDLRLFQPGGAAPVVDIPASQRANRIKILDSQLRTVLNINGRAIVVNFQTLSGYEMSGDETTFTNAGAVGTLQVRLPAATPGLAATFFTANSNAFQIRPSQTLPDTIRGGLAGQYAEFSATGENVTLYCVTAGFWEVKNLVGTIVFGGP